MRTSARSERICGDEKPQVIGQRAPAPAGRVTVAGGTSVLSAAVQGLPASAMATNKKRRFLKASKKRVL
ncbi:hypothetical protein [Massilia violaceinigra]|uniref:hypothetical protein n=1 Tax=Massilia violaceinigra TaxID=2045208 RepID=UPI0012FE51A5|nr:hypothetical protein [Massilia violaceinigra]